MSFHSLSRSNNRHNFIGADMGDIGSASPFAKATAEDGTGGFKMKSGKSQTKETETTIISFDEVDHNTRSNLAKEELRKKLSGRTQSSTEFQTIEKWHTCKDMNQELSPENIPRVMSITSLLGVEMENKHALPNISENVGATENVVTSRGNELPITTMTKKNFYNDEVTNPTVKAFLPISNKDDNDDSDDDYGEDVYGWRFDQTKEGDEENERNLEFHGTPKLNEEGTGAIGVSNRQASASATSTMPKSATSLKSHILPVNEKSFVSTERQKHVGNAVRKVVSVTSEGLKRIGSVVNHVSEATGKFLNDIDDPEHALGERTDSYMKIHDLNSAPTKDAAKKKRIEAINRVIEEARVFGVEDSDSSLGKDRGGQVPVNSIQSSSYSLNRGKGLTLGLEKVITTATMSHVRAPKPNKERGPVWEKTMNKNELFGSSHDMRFIRNGEENCISDTEYKTLFDVKDVRGYQEEYFGKNGPGILTMTAPEAHDILSKRYSLRASSQACSPQISGNIDRASIDGTASQNSLGNPPSAQRRLNEKESPTHFTTDPFSIEAQISMARINYKSPNGLDNMQGRGLHVIQDDQDVSMVSPSHGHHTTHAGLTRKDSMNRSVNKLSGRLEPIKKATPDLLSPRSRSALQKNKSTSGSKMNLLQASANFLSKEMKRASSWMLPPRNEEKVKLHTKKNPIPPAATITMGFSSERSGESSLVEKIPFSLLSPADRASSFASTFRHGKDDDNEVVVPPISKTRDPRSESRSSEQYVTNVDTHFTGDKNHDADLLAPLSLDTKDSRIAFPRENAMRPFGKAKNSGLLSDRHYTTIKEASVGLSKPVIYTPASTERAGGVSATGVLSVGEIRNPYSEVRYEDEVNLLEVSPIEKAQNITILNDENRRVLTPTSEIRPTRIAAASDVGPQLIEKDLNDTWKACWDAEAGSVYYYNIVTGEASWLPPAELVTDFHDAVISERNKSYRDTEDNGEEDGDDRNLFLRALNNGLPKGLSQLEIGDSDLTIRTRTIAARHSLYSKLRTRYEGDRETEYTAGLVAREHKEYGEKEHKEIMNELNKEVDSWIDDEA